MYTSIGLGNVALHDYTGFSLCHSCDLVWKINWSEDLLKSGGVTVLIQEPLPWRKSYFWGKENCDVGTRAHLCLYAGVHMQMCEHVCGRVCTRLWVCTHKCMCFDSPLCGCVWTYVRVYLCSPTPCRYPNITCTCLCTCALIHMRVNSCFSILLLYDQLGEGYIVIFTAEH